MSRHPRRGNGNPIAGLFLLIAGGVALLTSLFSGKPAPAPSPEVPAVIQPAAPSPQITSPAPETASAPAPQPAWRNVWISGHKVPIRSEPAAIAPIVDRVDNGLLVVEYERRDGWVLIEHPVTAKRGWVSAKRISLSAPSQSETERKRDEKIKPPSGVVLTTSAIVALLIKESLAEYHSHAPCACPYDRDRRGRQCGTRSAWSRPGGYAPLCYPRDVMPEPNLFSQNNGTQHQITKRCQLHNSGRYLRAHSIGALTPKLAKALGEKRGLPALHILKRYLDEANETVELSVTIYPADRFTFSMRLRRDRVG